MTFTKLENNENSMESCYLHDENHMVMQTSTHPPTHTLTQQHCFAPPMGFKAPALIV